MAVNTAVAIGEKTAVAIGKKIVLTGIARSKGKAAGEALVNRQRLSWA